MNKFIKILLLLMLVNLVFVINSFSYIIAPKPDSTLVISNVTYYGNGIGITNVTTSSTSSPYWAQTPAVTNINMYSGGIFHDINNVGDIGISGDITAYGLVTLAAGIFEIATTSSNAWRHSGAGDLWEVYRGWTNGTTATPRWWNSRVASNGVAGANGLIPLLAGVYRVYGSIVAQFTGATINSAKFYVLTVQVYDDITHSILDTVVLNGNSAGAVGEAFNQTGGVGYVRVVNPGNSTIMLSIRSATSDYIFTYAVLSAEYIGPY